jgi:lipopolysaccharide export system protein LptC
MTAPSKFITSFTTDARQRARYALSPNYSRFVGLAKRILPAVAVALLVLVAAWPRLEPLIKNVHLLPPQIDLREARDLRMVEAHYSGIDRQNRPFVVTAEVARQNPTANDIISLEEPKADLTTANGGWIKVTAYTGVYQPQAQLLDLFGNVQLFQHKGNQFRTDSAHVDTANGTAEGHEPIEGEGPFGHVSGQGFRILDRGDTIIFTGRSHLELVAHDGKVLP